MEKFEKIIPGENVDPIQALVEFLENKFSEKLDININERDGLLEGVEKKELLVNDSDVLSLLKKYGIPIEDKDIREDLETGYFHIAIDKFFGKIVPNGYAYKGGAARALLKLNFFDEKNVEPRDLDVVRMSDENINSENDLKISKEFMPNDFEHGDGVEVMSDMNTYFETRDFTINEILATNKEIILTKQCLMDTVRHIIRITEYEFDGQYDSPKYKQLAKALRLYAEEINRYGDATMENVANWEYESYFINPFWMAIHLDRAYQKGYVVAKDYADLLVSKGSLPEEIKDPEQAASYILSIIEDNNNFYYRHAPVGQMDLEDELIEKFGIDEDMYVDVKKKKGRLYDRNKQNKK